MHLICLLAEADLINTEGAIWVRMPIKGREGLVEINSKKAAGKNDCRRSRRASIPCDYDLVALAMQEPQYRSAGVRKLLDAVAQSECLAWRS